jgi:regulator of RNase E activity RraB
MGFLPSIFNRRPKRFLTEEAHRTNLVRQKTMTPQTIAQLRKHGVAEATRLKLEYFFYTNDASKAAQLAGKLRTLGYEASSGRSAGVKKLELVTGWTTPIQMSDKPAIAWTEQMCQLGFEHDAEFDGWGTPVP